MTSTIPHHPVMLREVIAGLNILPDGIYIDGTFGRGGHSQAILNQLGPQGRLICCDKDPSAISFAQTHFGQDERVIIVQSCFSEILKIVKSFGFDKKINGIILDLGVSSPQLEEASRGFSFMRDGPLDMRMDPLSGFSAADWVNNAPLEEIVHILRKYGEEAFATKIARKICEIRALKAIETTLELANLIEHCLPAKKNHRHPATKTFQAIRLHVNQELKAIDDVLVSAREVLALDGRLVIISFHSLEDRIVKRYFREQSRCKLPKGIAIPEKELTTPFKWVIKRQFPQADEIGINQRARSAVLRVAQRTAF